DELDDTVGSDVWDRYQPQSGGNADLSQEVSISETIGIVFTPRIIPDLQASVDYYETSVQGGIEELSGNAALQRCARELGDGLAMDETVYCKNNVVFGPPEPQFEGQ